MRLSASSSHREETVLEALRREGIALPAPCGGAGTCGKCRVLLTRVEGAPCEEVLACQVQAAAGMEVRVDDAALPGLMVVSMGGEGCVGRFVADAAEGGLGVALDVGTTTLVCRLIDLATGAVLASAGLPNPQGTYGADVLSRIAAVREGHLEELAELVGQAIAHVIGRVVSDAGVHASAIDRVALGGNTVMEHLVAGVDPTPIGSVPFTPPSLFGEERVLDALSVAGCSVREASFAPCIAGYVGGDIAADILACGMAESASPVLMLDLGTNGEMALGSAEGVVTCATAAGPVFEGASIRFGMPAYPGAVAKVRLDGDALTIETVSSEPAKGICGTGLIDVVALLLDAGIVDESGAMAELDEIADGVPDDLASRMGVLDGAPAFWVTSGIAVTQADVRALQLAKAAIFAGAQTLLDECGIASSEVERLVVAGGFGEHLDLVNAARIGLFPEELGGVAESVGNIAIEGVGAALVSHAAREELVRIAKEARYQELSTSIVFNERYIEAMEFPDQG